MLSFLKIEVLCMLATEREESLQGGLLVEQSSITPPTDIQGPQPCQNSGENPEIDIG